MINFIKCFKNVDIYEKILYNLFDNIGDFMKNNKGFVLTETLVVTVFLVTIFTFIYVSIVPLIGKYEDMVSRKSNIDIVYKLYHVRKMISKDNNRTTITTTYDKPITCSDFDDTTFCNKLMQFQELDTFLLICTNNINTTLTNLNNSSYVSSYFSGYSQDNIDEIISYLSDYENLDGKFLILLDRGESTISHLEYY